jgi:hypothetical protein
MIELGTVIKSYDFPGRTDCYIIGSVVDISKGRITAKVIRAISQGKLYQFPDTEFSTYPQGTGMFDDEWTRVEIVG